MVFISQTKFSDAVSLIKSFVFWLKFTEICSLEYIWQYLSIRLDNGLAPNSRQVIIWTNADPIHWRIYAAIRGDELSEYPQNISKSHARYLNQNFCQLSAVSSPGGRLNKKDGLTRYGDSHVKDKTS